MSTTGCSTRATFRSGCVGPRRGATAPCSSHAAPSCRPRRTVNRTAARGIECDEPALRASRGRPARRALRVVLHDDPGRLRRRGPRLGDGVAAATGRRPRLRGRRPEPAVRPADHGHRRAHLPLRRRVHEGLPATRPVHPLSRQLHAGDARPGAGRQPRRAVRLLGAHHHHLVPAHRLLARERRGQALRPSGAARDRRGGPGDAGRLRRPGPGRRHLQPAGDAGGPEASQTTRTTPRSSSWCCSAPSPSRRNSRSTSGCRTRWRPRRRSRPTCTRRRWSRPACSCWPA